MYNNSGDKQIQVVNKGVFYKVKMFFAGLFNKEENRTNTYGMQAQNVGVDTKTSFSEVHYNYTARTDFVNRQKVAEPTLELMADSLEKGELTIEEINESDKIKIINLFNNRIETRKQKLDEVKGEIMQIKTTLASNNI